MAKSSMNYEDLFITTKSAVFFCVTTGGGFVGLPVETEKDEGTLAEEP